MFFRFFTFSSGLYLISPIKAGNRASDSWAWCFTSRKPLFLRPEAPRHSGRMGLRRLGRGASPPANPCFFVRRHHATRTEWGFGGWGVVLHLPETLVSSSGGTTPLGPNESLAVGAWCFTSRKPLFLRPEAPRHSGRMGLRRLGRGASPPGNPCSFIRRHHATRKGSEPGPALSILLIGKQKSALKMTV